MALAIGIDLGTTSSRVATIQYGAPVIIENSEGEGTTPSHVAVTRDGRRLVGEAARRYALQAPESVAFSVKRLIGRRFNDPEIRQIARFVPYRIVEAENGDAWIELNRQRFSPSQLSAFTLLKMKQTAERYLGSSDVHAVITVPAYFLDSQRQATRDAAHIAGIPILRIISEPVAAALFYGFREKEGLRTIVVYDLGGGTFDASVLQIGDGVFEVKSTDGDTFLGGEDFDYAIAEHIARRFNSQHGPDLLKEPVALQRLKQAAEMAKIDLSSASTARIDLPFIHFDGTTSYHLEETITRYEVEGLLEPLVKRTIAICESALREANISSSEIDAIVLVGGSTRIPLVQKSLQSYFGKAPIGGLRREDVVALGAAIQASILSGEIRDQLLLDVTPSSLGIQSQGGAFATVVDRNTLVPTRRAVLITTSENDQRTMTIRICQGESAIAEHNKLLGQFDIVDIPPERSGDPRIELVFDIDVDGLLEIHVQALTEADKLRGRDWEATILLGPSKSQSEQKISVTYFKDELPDPFRVRTLGDLTAQQIASMSHDAQLKGVSSTMMTQPAGLDATPPKQVRESAFEPPPASVSSNASHDTRDNPTRPRVFVSYAHEDTAFARSIEKALALLVRGGKMDLWVDRHIRPGEEWEKKIFSALERSNIAVLLLSNDFLSSDFIAAKELPAIFAEKERRRLTLLPIVVRPCPYELHDDLTKFQMFNNPDAPLASLKEWEMEAELVRLAREINKASR